MNNIRIVVENVHNKIVSGMNKACEIVKKTYGPLGKMVIIDKGFIDITCDGYTVINSIKLRDKLENVGVELLKSAAYQTKEMIGDGTTSTVILGTELCNKIIKYELNDYVDLKRIIQKLETYILDELDKQRIEIIDKKTIKTICEGASNDKQIGELISKVSEEIGISGTIITKPTYKDMIYYECYKGLVYDKGLVSSYLSDDAKVILNDAYVIVLNDNINTINEFETIIYDIKKTKKDILVIANSFSKEVIDYIIYLKRSFNYKIFATYSPEFGNNSKEILSDIALYLDTFVITNKTIYTNIDEVGKAKYIEITKDMTIIKSYDESNILVENRINELKKLEQTYIIKKRIMMLNGNIGCIFIPYNNEFEYELLHEKISNAIESLKVARTSGVVFGAGKALLNIVNSYDGDGIYKEIINSLGVINNTLLGNNYLEKNSEKVFDPLLYVKTIVRNSFNLLKLFISLGGFIEITEENDREIKDNNLKYFLE